MSNPRLPLILDALFPAQSPRWARTYAVLDSARDERIFDLIDRAREDKACLYAGRLPFALQRTAPYLVELERDSPLTRRLIEEGWGNSWGIFVASDAGMHELRRHLRHFLRVQDERGKRLIFRWYDPRVLRLYLPTCLAHEAENFFGPVESFFMEAPEPETMLQFRIVGGALYPTKRKV